MQKFIVFLIIAIFFSALGFSFAKFCPLGIKLSPTEAKAHTVASDPTQAQLDSSLISALYSARHQLELYYHQHNDTCPDFRKYGWKQLTYKTTAKGQISEQGKELSSALFGPYFNSPPQNPLTKSSEVLVVPSIPEDFKSPGAYGFVFAEDTGRFFGLSSDGRIIDDVPSADAR